MDASAHTDDTLSARVQDAVDADVVNASVAALARFGGRDDGGVSRQTLTTIEIEARHYLIDQARQLGCTARVDDCGNLFFRRPGREDVPPVLTGSHADTQPVGGKLDGAYGVIAGLEVIRALNDAGVETVRPVEVVVWTNEEGSRFGPGTMGSSAFVDPSRLPSYRASRDQAGVTFGDALDVALAATADVPRAPMRAPIDSYVELHIEQGPVLETAGIPLGVVDSIQSVRWYSVTLKGAAAHAGTTPMAVRSDAMATAITLSHQLMQTAAAVVSSGLRLTLGRWRVAPNSINTIAGEVEFSIDVRCVDEARLADFEAALHASVAAVDAGWAGSIGVTPIFSRGTTRFPERMLAVLDRGCRRAMTEVPSTGQSGAQADAQAPMRMTSGAFHDAMYMADHCPTAMIFVPSQRGISHNAAEYTDPRELYLGVRALAHAVTELANRPNAAPLV